MTNKNIRCKCGHDLDRHFGFGLCGQKIENFTIRCPCKKFASLSAPAEEPQDTMTEIIRDKKGNIIGMKPYNHSSSLESLNKPEGLVKTSRIPSGTKNHSPSEEKTSKVVDSSGGDSPREKFSEKNSLVTTKPEDTLADADRHALSSKIFEWFDDFNWEQYYIPKKLKLKLKKELLNLHKDFIQKLKEDKKKVCFCNKKKDIMSKFCFECKRDKDLILDCIKSKKKRKLSYENIAQLVLDFVRGWQIEENRMDIEKINEFAGGELT